MTPEDAYELLEAIAIISDSKNKLKKIKKVTAKQTVRKPPIDFFKCGFKVGDQFTCTEDPSIKVTVQDAHKVLYNDELTSLSAIMKDMKGYSIAGPSFFTYNGELLTDIANRTQWKQ